MLDSRPFEIDAPDGVGVRFAPGGRNAGDDEIVRIVEADRSPETLTVVTSDRELARTCTRARRKRLAGG